MVFYKNYLLVYHRPKIGYFDPIFHYQITHHEDSATFLGINEPIRHENRILKIKIVFQVCSMQCYIFQGLSIVFCKFIFLQEDLIYFPIPPKNQDKLEYFQIPIFSKPKRNWQPYMPPDNM